MIVLQIDLNSLFKFLTWCDILREADCGNMENSVKSSFSRGILFPLKPLRCVTNQLHGMIGHHADLNLIFSFGGNILYLLL